MPGRISDEKREEILRSTSIVDLVGERVQLRAAGREFVGLCPFHGEKTPSFYVNPEKGLYHCHGCGAGGDAIKFLMGVGGLTFPDALESLARRSGIVLEEEDPHAARESAHRRRLLDALFWAAGRYRAAFRAPMGKIALDYMRSRGFTDATLDTFGIGWAPAGWDNLVERARKDGIDLPILEEVGLISPRTKGGEGWYDFFRERVLFPIADEAGRVVGFGGRLLEGKEKKYINSRHTPVYNKSRVLYGLDLARASAAKAGLVIVEGYVDAMALHQAGRPNVVASLGTAFTEHQADLVKRSVREHPVTLLFDSDSAGEKAAERGIENFLARDLAVRVATLPGGLDPDEFVHQQGVAAFDRLVESAEDFLDFKIRVVGERCDLGSLDGQAAAIDAVLATVARLANPIKRRLALQRMGSAFPVPTAELESRLQDLTANRSPFRSRPTASEAPPLVREPERVSASPRFPPPPLPRRADHPGWLVAGEEFVLQALLFAPELAEEVEATYPLDCFADPAAANLARRLLAAGGTGAIGEDLLRRVLEDGAQDQAGAERLRAISRRHTARPSRTEIDYRQEFAKFLENVQKRKNRLRVAVESQTVRRAEAAGDREALNESLKTVSKIVKE